jgi:hypothetical protein
MKLFLFNLYSAGEEEQVYKTFRAALSAMFSSPKDQMFVGRKKNIEGVAVDYSATILVFAETTFTVEQIRNRLCRSLPAEGNPARLLLEIKNPVMGDFYLDSSSMKYWGDEEKFAELQTAFDSFVKENDSKSNGGIPLSTLDEISKEIKNQ